MARNPPIRRLGAFVIAVALSPTALAQSSAPSGLPSVDYSKMGNVALGGAFSGLDWFSTDSPFASSSSSGGNTTRVTYSSDGDTLIMRNDDGSTTVLGATNAGGEIRALCWSQSEIGSSSGSNGTLYVGGSFSSLGSASSSNIAAYSLSTQQFSALTTGLSGPVSTLFCDDSNEEVWAGGLFNAPSGSGGNVARWSTQSKDWSDVPFGGLNGLVESIEASEGGKSLYFGGQFTTQFNDSRNASAFISLASVSIAPPNTITTGTSGYYTPFTIPAAVSQYGGLSINAAPATGQGEYNDANVLVCPGSGSWLARDSSVATVEILGHAFLTGVGARIANTHVEGRATKAFHVTSLPDNSVLTLTYTDPSTNKTATCSNKCPLSTDANIHAQDFLFTDGARNMTGLQVILDEWDGGGSGLDYVQLLSNGAYTSAVESDNQGICGSSNNSVETVGSWESQTGPSTIPGTEIGYMAATVPSNNPTDTSLVLYPYVGSSGFYEVYLVIPGCANLGDCNSRTVVNVAMFPQQGGLPYTIAVDQRVQDDTWVLIYAGLVDATTNDWAPTINIQLPGNPETTSSSDYVVVASGVQMVLTGLSDGTQSPWGTPPPEGSTTTGGTTATSGATTGGTTGGTTASTTGGTTGSTTGGTTASSTTSTSTSTSASATPTPSAARTAFGIYEWTRSTSGINAASSVLPNNTETGLTQLGFTLQTALNASSDKNWEIGAVTSTNNTVFVAGKFTGPNSYANVLAVEADAGVATPLANQGLNGAVHAAAVVDGKVFFGGMFTGTQTGNTILNRVAQYDPSAKSWSALGGGVDGPVTDIVPLTQGVAIVGNFSNVIAANGSFAATGGYAVYNTSSSEWMPKGVIYGTGAAAASSGSSTFLGGRIYGMSLNSVSGVAGLVMNKDGTASIETLGGVSFSNIGSAQSTDTSNSSITTRWFWSSRSSRSSISARADAVQIVQPPAVAPATLAGAFWTNSSAKGKPSLTILGGNFTQNGISGVAFHSSDGGMTGPSPGVTGVVRALNVVDDMLFIGGSNVAVEDVGTGIVKFNLKDNVWVPQGMATATAASGTEVNVNAIRTRLKTDTVVAAGNFVTMGSFSCPAVCLWNGNQWNAPGGSGPTGGEVRSIDLGGHNYDTLVAGGSFVLGGENVFAAVYYFGNSTWRALPALPGPVMSIAMNDQDTSNIFATGYGTSDSKLYFMRFDGSSWHEENSNSLEDGTVIQNLAFVPLKTEHEAQGSIDNNRMLMASGEVFLAQQGNVSSALYDGAQWHPYLVGSTATGALGAASSLFWSNPSINFNLQRYLARGLVVLVAMAIATALILLLILIGLLIACCARRVHRRSEPRREMYAKEPTDGSVSSTDELLFNSMQTALQHSLVPGAAGAGVGAGAAGVGAMYKDRSGNESAESHYHDAMELTEGTAGEPNASDEGSEEGRETVMRYDFVGPELQTGELAMRAGQRIIILDDEQSDEWWYARDPATGHEGVVPATYVL